MSTIEANMDVETQRRIEYTRQKLMRIEQLNEQLRKLENSNQIGEQKLNRLIQRKASLENDIQRLADASMEAAADDDRLGFDLLCSIEEPHEMEMICAEEIYKKMMQLKILLTEIIVRTCFNEKAMCTEIGHQESEFQMRLEEAIRFRQQLISKNHKIQQNCESLVHEQAALYETVRQIEENIQKFDASQWLLNVESRRVSDILDRTKRDSTFAKKKKKEKEETKEGTASEFVTSSSLVGDLSSLSAVTPSLKHRHSELCVGEEAARPNVVQPSRETMMVVQKNTKCPIHENLKLPPSENSSKILPLKGVDLMKLISDVIENEFFK